MKIPIVQMAEAETKLAVGGLVVINRSGSGSETPEWKRWNDYGIGLLEQAQYGAAAEAFQRASGFNPTDPNLLVNAAIAEMQTERFAPEREQFRKAALLLDAALQLAPQHARTRYYRALVWRADGRFREAAEELKQIAGDYPRDREVQRQLAHTLWSLGRLAEARGALETVLRIDPTDFLAYQFLSPLYLSEGRKAEAARANALYLLWRDDPRADAIAARFYAAHPEWADERIGSHTHDQHSSRRPVLIGQHASPDK